MQILITGANGFIGTNLVTALRSGIDNPYTAALIDIAAPKIELNAWETWFRIDILDYPSLETIVEKTKPGIVIHLAGETSCEPELTLDDYLTNTKGSKNLFTVCSKFNIEFLIHTSTQFVNQASSMPTSDTDFAPHTVYGESKVLAEQLLRKTNYSFRWCIIRPTNIWGSWHLRYPSEFWKILKEGKYLHPGKKKVMRSYGYVGNVCWQIIEIIKRRNEPVFSENVLYVGDMPVKMFEWVNDFSIAINKKPVRIVPTFIVYILALTGSALRRIRIRFPITLSRYKSMTTNNPAPMDKTFAILGTPPFTQKEGVKQTTEWLFEFWQKQN